MAAQPFTMQLERKTGWNPLSAPEIVLVNGNLNHYEETYDGTGAGMHKFRNDVANYLNLEGDFDVFVKSSARDQWIKVHDGRVLDRLLGTEVRDNKQSKMLYVKVEGGKKSSWTPVLLGAALVGGIVAFVVMRNQQSSSPAGRLLNYPWFK